MTASPDPLSNILVRLRSYDITRGPSYALERKKKAADLTKEMLDSGAWETTEFKPYNFATVGEKVGGGYLHPLLKVRAEFRKVRIGNKDDEKDCY